MKISSNNGKVILNENELPLTDNQIITKVQREYIPAMTLLQDLLNEKYDNLRDGELEMFAQNCLEYGIVIEFED